MTELLPIYETDNYILAVIKLLEKEKIVYALRLLTKKSKELQTITKSCELNEVKREYALLSQKLH